MPRASICLFVFLFLALGEATAQTPGSLAEGQRVRFTYRCQLAQGQVANCTARTYPRFDAGILQAADGDTLRIQGTSSERGLAIPQAFVDQV